MVCSLLVASIEAQSAQCAVLVTRTVKAADEILPARASSLLPNVSRRTAATLLDAAGVSVRKITDQLNRAQVSVTAFRARMYSAHRHTRRPRIPRSLRLGTASSRTRC